MKTFNFLLLLLAFTSLPAQEQPPPGETVSYDFSFSVFPLEGGDWSGIFFAPKGNPEKESVEVAFNPHQRSLTYEYNATTPLVFFRKSQNAEGETLFKPVAVFQGVPGKLPHDLILFFIPGKKNEPIEIQAMVDSPETYPPNSIVFYNTLSIPLVGVLGDQRLQLGLGPSAPVRLEDYYDKEVPIALAIHHEDDFHLVAKNQVRFERDRRTILILRKPKRANSTRILSQRLTEYSGPRSEEESTRPSE
jgi:hypothetical protein